MPFVDVSHLPASSSFFSAVLQPLGLCLIDSGPSDGNNSNTVRGQSPSSVTYGADGKAVLQICQTPASAASPRPSSLVLTAPSRSAVARFHACGLKANPLLGPLGAPLRASGQAAWLGTDDGGLSRAVLHDLDGNRMEVVYPDPSPRQDPVHYTGKPVRRTQSTRDEVGRILDWNYGVASAAPATSPRPSISASATSATAPGLTRAATMSRRPQEPPQPLRRSLPNDTRIQQSRQPTTPSQQPVPAPPHESATVGGLSTTAVVGAILGAAAGAALTYGLVSQERSRVPRHEVDAVPGPAPGLPRRSTFPEKLGPAHYGGPRLEDHDKRHRLIGRHGDEYTSRRIAYADVVDDYEHAWPPPKYLPQRSHHETAASSSSVAKSAPRNRAVDDAYDVRSRHSSRMGGSRAHSSRSRSEAPITRVPFDPIELDQQSYAISRHSAAPKSSHSHSRSHRPTRELEQDSYVSAQTHRSDATARAPAPLPGHMLEQDLVYRSRAGSRVSTVKAPASGGHAVARRASSKAPSSYVSARGVPLPPSGVGSSHANWDDDMGSVAPSDSISCVGSKTSRRSRRHH